MTTSQPAPGAPLTRVYARVTQVLSLAPDGSVAHTLEAYRDGLRVTLDRGEHERPLYAVALPWARGFTVFTTDDAHASNHDWHHNTGYSQRVSNPRNITGAHNVDADKLANAFADAVEYLDYFYGVHDHTTNDYANGESDYFDGEDGGPGDCVFYNLT